LEQHHSYARQCDDDEIVKNFKRSKIYYYYFWNLVYFRCLCHVCDRGGRTGAYDRESIDNGPPGPPRWSDSRDGSRSANYSSGRWDDRSSDARSSG